MNPKTLMLMKKITLFFLLLLTFSFYSCEDLTEDTSEEETIENGTGIETGTGTGTGTGSGTGSGGTGIYNGSKPTGNYWSRNDGLGTAYLSLSGSTAKACANGTETIGTFNASKPSMTFTIGKDVLEFPLLFQSGKLYVGAPAQAVSTHNAQTQYVSTTKYTCGSSSGGTTTPEKGSVVFWSNLKNTDKRVYGSINITFTEKGSKRSGNIEKYGASSPGCDVAGTPGWRLDPATYNWTATWQFSNAYGQLVTTSQGGTFTVTSKGCTAVQVK